MAIMIPSVISPDVKSDAEKRIFKWFKDAPGTDDWIVLHSLGLAYHSTLIHGETDFVVIAPHLGIFALEVKGGQVRRSSDGIWSFINRYGQENRKERGPFDQAWDGIHSIIDFIQKLMAKLPAVVILMLLFYVVFNDSSINAGIVSILGFGFLFGNTFYGLIKAGDSSVDYGQKEAAEALGYNRWLSFHHIILPQIMKIVKESYLREIMSLIKNSSIVGYVSVNDLTRSSDIIRGRTYDALFPLIVTAIVY